MVFASRVMIVALTASLSAPALAVAAEADGAAQPAAKGFINPFSKPTPVAGAKSQQSTPAAGAKSQSAPATGAATPTQPAKPGSLLQAIQAAQSSVPAAPASGAPGATTATTPLSAGIAEMGTTPAPAIPNPPLNKEVKLHRPLLSPASMSGSVLKFDNADIYEVLQIILGDMLHLNFIVDPSIQGKVTIASQGAISQADLFNILESILSLNNLSLLRDGKLYRVVKDANAPRETLTFEALGENSPMIQIIPINFVQATALVNTLKNFIGQQAGITNDPTNKYLIVADRANNISKILDLIKALDVDYLQNVNIRLVQVQKGDAQEIAKEMDTLFKSSGMFNVPGTEPNKIFFMPIKRMNALLVAGTSASVLEAAEKWIKKLDDGTKDDTEARIHVHSIENSTAVRVANILRQIYGGAPIASEASKTIVKGAVPAPAAAAPAPGTGLTGSVQIIPDEATNLLVIKASPQDYIQIKKVIDSIDLVPRQVLIQVMVAEVTLNKATEFGIEWWLKNNNRGINGRDFSDQISLGTGQISNAAVNLGAGDKGPNGLNYMLLNGANNVVGLMKAVASSGNVNVLSTPSVMASDGKEAKIEVGADMPMVTQTTTVPGTTTSNNSTSNSVTYRPTGIILTVKPHVNASGLVSLSISQEVSDLGAAVEAGGQNYPQFTKRKVETEVTIEGGKTLMIAGLIKDKTDNSNKGIPGLKDIPILGYLFGGKSDSVNKTELMITITPYVVRNREEGDKVTASFKDGLQGIKHLMGGKQDMQPISQSFQPQEIHAQEVPAEINTP